MRVLDGSLYTSPRLFCQFRPTAGAQYRIPGAEVRINSLGLRGEEVSREKPPGVFRVLCLGGSTTFDYFNEAGVHWPKLLEDKLRAEHPGRKVEVLNAGVPGGSTAHSLTWLLFDGLALSPDAIIVHHNVNDLSVNFHGEVEPDYANKYGLPEWDPRPELRRNLADCFLGWSQAYLFLRLKLYPLVAEARHVEVHSYPGDRGLPAAPFFRRNLESICAVAQANDVRVVLGLEPEDILHKLDGTLVTQLGLGGDLVVPDAETLKGFQKEYLRIVRQVGERWGATLVDADAVMSGRADLFVDTCHTTAAGSEMLAELFRKAVSPLLRSSPSS